MQRLVPKLDATSVQIALKTLLALILGLAISLQLDWKPSFGAILIVVLQASVLGTTYHKGMLYIAGTLGGAIVGLALVALFAHDRVAFIVAAALLISFGIYRLQTSRYLYVWLIFNVTVILVAFFSTPDFSNAFEIAVSRSSTICLAGVIMFLVQGILWPTQAGTVFERQLHGFMEGCHGLLSPISRSPAGSEPDPHALREAGTAQVQALAALRRTLEAAALDTERFRQHHASYEWLLDQLHNLLLAILVVRESLAGTRDAQARRSLMAGSDKPRPMLEQIESDMQELVADLARPRDGTASPRASDRGARAPIDQSGALDTADAAMLAGSLRDLAGQVSGVRATLAGVEDPGQVPPPRPAPPREPFSLTSVKLRKAAGGGLVVLLLGWFFIQTQWPEGLVLGMLFATIAINIIFAFGAFGLVVPFLMLARQMLLSLLTGAAIAAPLYFGIMPGISQFQQLIPWLCVALFPLLYMMASKPQKIIQYLFSAIIFIALLGLDEERQSYSFSAFLNMWLGICGGFGGALAVFGLFSSEVPEREFCKHVRSFFTGCGQFVTGFRERAPGTPAGAAIVSTGQERWQPVLKQLQTWSSAINYKRVPGNDRQKTQALIESIESLALRLPAAERVGQPSVESLDEPLRTLLGRFYDACVESFQLIANSLAALQPIPDLPDTKGLVREIESRGDGLRRSAGGDEDARAFALSLMSETARLGSLADAIHDCRDKANALDWEAWNRNYF